MISLLLLLLPIAAVFGWYAGYKHKLTVIKKANLFSHDYFRGLKYLIEEQPDKAVDIFIKMLEVNSDTVETHLALGGLFRRRGEVDRAIRIHQNLIARPQLAKNQRVRALSELAQDYMRAGVLDRAENLFLELANLDKKTETNFTYLLTIYEQQKDWPKAIVIAEKLETEHGIEMVAAIAHYYCELGKPKKALAVDKSCVRGSLLQGSLYMNDGDFKNAIRTYKMVTEQNPDFITEIINPLTRCYEKLNNEQELINYLQNCLVRYPRVSIILALAGFLRKHHNDFAAIEFITEQMTHYPSLRGLSYLTELYIDNSEGDTKKKFLLLQELIKKFLIDKPIYRCVHCGFSSKNLYWHCPSCKHWNSVKPILGLEGD
jgi:lipopolysaccharide biosynthesis regulator YciM